ncbi:hypothetical protein, partial [Staphylococcus capitis]|uniref:hypothetical protein n=1 Tax=Staphylococcus capitis TaxID=29388 RepID=UPI001C9319F0
LIFVFNIKEPTNRSRIKGILMENMDVQVGKESKVGGRLGGKSGGIGKSILRVGRGDRCVC